MSSYGSQDSSVQAHSFKFRSDAPQKHFFINPFCAMLLSVTLTQKGQYFFNEEYGKKPQGPYLL